MTAPDAPSPLDDPTIVDYPGDRLPLAAPLGPGSQFGGYEVLAILGQGGMGTVYRARQLSLGRLVALKVLDLRSHRAADLERFANEARAAARLVHPGIVQIHDVGQVDGRHYLALELVRGIGLDRLIDRERVPPRRALEIVASLADAVHYAHGMGVIHRDLKPSNVLIDDRGHPRLVDFGLARRIGTSQQLTESGQTLGTPAYMAPEQVSHESGAIGRPTDVHGLGAILYELLARQAPFVGDNPLQMLHQVLYALPAAPHEIAPDVPLSYSQICLKCLAKNPADRYPTARALAIDCLGVLEPDRPLPGPAPLPPRLRRLPGRRLLLLAGLLLLGVLIAYQAATRQARQPVDPDLPYLQAMLAGDLDAAYRHLALLVARRPRDWKLRRRRVELALELKRPGDAIGELLAIERGEKLSADEIRTLLALQLQQGQLGPAKQLVERVFSRDPALWRRFSLEVASHLEQQKQPYRAARYLHQAVRRSAHPDLSNRLARLRLAAGDALDAVRVWLAIPLESADPRFLAALKQAAPPGLPPERLLALARRDACFVAWPALADWLTTSPERVEALGPQLLEKLLIEACRDRKREALARTASKALAAKDPARCKRLAEDAERRGQEAYRANRNAEAVQYLTLWLLLQPQAAEAWHLRGKASHHMGDWPGAIADFTRAIELEPKKAGHHYLHRAAARREKGDYEGTIADCTRAIELDPKKAGPYQMRGIARRDKGDYEGAIADYTRAIELDPAEIRGYAYRAIALLRTGQREASLADAQRVRRWRTEARSAQLRSSVAYDTACMEAVLGRPDAAFAALDRAIELGYSNWRHLQRDPDLAALRSDPRWKALLARKPR